MIEQIHKCMMCPHKCGIDREKTLGRCKVGSNVKLALVSTHDYEEPCISGENGSGTIFFSGCNLNCVYCQNYEISSGGFGKEITTKRLAEIMLEQQARNVENINLVTPTMYIAQIKEAIKEARKRGLTIPIVYNTSGYETVEMIISLEEYIDIYLTDFKYFDNDLAKRYSNINNYFECASQAIIEMKKQKQDTFDDRGIMKSGVIVRHMILPNHTNDTKNVIKWVRDNLGKDTVISVMAQYFPTYRAKEFPEINRKITKQELDEVESFLFENDMLNGYIQELGEHEEEYVPNFNLDNV